jgi:hypothetical protein
MQSIAIIYCLILPVPCILCRKHMDSVSSYNNLSHDELQHELLFSEISPMWSERLNLARDNISPISVTRLRWYLELKNSSTCVVGEANGFSAAYVSKCYKCNKLGWRFMFYFLIQSDSRIEKTKIKFVDHWNREHSFKTKMNLIQNHWLANPFL